MPIDQLARILGLVLSSLSSRALCQLNYSSSATNIQKMLLTSSFGGNKIIYLVDWKVGVNSDKIPVAPNPFVLLLQLLILYGKLDVD